MKEKIKSCKYIIIILITALIVGIPLFWKNLDVYADDGIQHLVRGFLTSNSVKAGENTNVLNRLANGFGYSWNLFYGPLSSFLIVLLNFITNNIIVAYKLLVFLGLFFSGFTMYCFLKKLTIDKNIGAIGAILYITMPYHLTDLYVRNALGEFLSYIFVPLVFLGLYNLFNKEKKDWLLVIGSVGLIITHNLMAMITALIAGIYFFINCPKLKDKQIRSNLIFDLIFIICITSFYTLPLLQTSINTNYEVYNPRNDGNAKFCTKSRINIKTICNNRKWICV